MKTIDHPGLALAVVTLAISLGGHQSARGDYLVGILSGFGGTGTVRIDPNTGTYTTISNTAQASNSLAQDTAGRLYLSWSINTQSNGRVSRFNAFDGSLLQTFATATPGAGGIRGMSFDAADNLFAVLNRDDAQGSPTIDDDLYTFDLATETTSLVGSLGFSAVQGLDFAANGDLYAWDILDGLLQVDPNTGAAVDINPAVGGTANIQSIAFAPDGRLFGARENLFQIDLTTGTFTQIGTGLGLDVRGIEWVVPEPSLAGYCLTAAIAYFACSRRHPG